MRRRDTIVATDRGKTRSQAPVRHSPRHLPVGARHFTSAAGRGGQPAVACLGRATALAAPSTRDADSQCRRSVRNSIRLARCTSNRWAMLPKGTPSTNSARGRGLGICSLECRRKPTDRRLGPTSPKSSRRLCDEQHSLGKGMISLCDESSDSPASWIFSRLSRRNRAPLRGSPPTRDQRRTIPQSSRPAVSGAIDDKLVCSARPNLWNVEKTRGASQIRHRTFRITVRPASFGQTRWSRAGRGQTSGRTPATTIAIDRSRRIVIMTICVDMAVVLRQSSRPTRTGQNGLALVGSMSAANRLRVAATGTGPQIIGSILLRREDDLPIDVRQRQLSRDRLQRNGSVQTLVSLSNESGSGAAMHVHDGRILLDDAKYSSRDGIVEWVRVHLLAEVDAASDSESERTSHH